MEKEGCYSHNYDSEEEKNKKIIKYLIIAIVIVFIVILVLILILIFRNINQDNTPMIPTNTENQNSETPNSEAGNQEEQGENQQTTEPISSGYDLCEKYSDEKRVIECKIIQSSHENNGVFCTNLDSNVEFSFYSTTKKELFQISAKDYCWLKKTQIEKKDYCYKISVQEIKEICGELI